MSTSHRIVVGLDESDQARAALRFAAEEAAWRGATLDVVNVYSVPLSFAPAPTVPSLALPTEADHIRAQSERLVAEVVEGVLEHVAARPPDVQHISVEGTPGPTLVDCSTGADLLVVGSRSRSTLSRLLGSVSSYCVHHARCPVVVVPTPEIAREHQASVVG